MKNHKAVALLIIIAAFTTSAFAREGDYFMGVEGGVARTRFDFQSEFFVPDATSSDDETRVIGIFGGLDISQHFAVELAYADLGETSFTYVRNFLAPQGPGLPSRPIRRESLTYYETSVLSVSFLGRYELTERWTLVGRAGVGTHRIETTMSATDNGQPVPIRGSVDESKSPLALIAGFGIDWSFHEHWSARLHARHHFVKEEIEAEINGITTIATGIEYRF